MKDHEFGGVWTEQKLQHVSDYMAAYLRVMKNQAWCEELIYIDCFSGTGYRNVEEEAKVEKTDDLLLFEEKELEEGDLAPEVTQDISEGYRDGSARIALKTGGFDRYVFVEKAKRKCQALHLLRADFPDRRIDIHQGDVNEFLQNEVARWSWRKNRACVFIDPYGMQLEWKSLEALAKTKAADVWILMPVGVGVNRMLTKSGKIQSSWEKRLTAFFGCPPEEWRARIYRDNVQQTLWGEETETKKIPKLEQLADYLLERLGTIFPGVAQNPKALGPPKAAPLFYLFFAAANQKGAPTAIKIAEWILEERAPKASRSKSRRPKGDQFSSC